MRSFAGKLASEVIAAHMHGVAFKFANDSFYEVALYSKHFEPLYGEEFHAVEFDQQVYQKKKALYLVDRSAQLHLGVKYIVIKDTHIFQELSELKVRVVSMTVIILLFISLIGYFLSKISLQPLSAERQRLDKFIKDTTHELNTPLTALLMSIKNLETPNTKALERINLSANRISSIYEDLCFLLKEETTKYPLEKVHNIDLKEIIQEQILLMEPYAKIKKVAIIQDLQNNIVRLDLQSAQRLVSNLLSNALKYSFANSSIEITLQNNKLQIKDYGIGIDQEEIQRIKERYYRANKEEGGFGIGLDIVNLICKKYKIIFDIESKPKVGTTITLYF